MFGFYSYCLLTSRLEINNYVILQDFDSNKSKCYNEFFMLFMLNNRSYKERVIINIYVLELLGTYRGWRHSRGLPVRGQRTWSNGWSPFRSNLILRNFKLRIAKKIYGHSLINVYFVAYLAEEVNNMWKSQWHSEWLQAKMKRLKTKQSKNTKLKIDFLSMSKMEVDGFSKKEKSNRKKNISKKNSFTLGFDPGFTKILLKKNMLDKIINYKGSN